MSELTVQYLVLERCDPARNMARFYVLTIEPTLFGDTALVREWGRLGQRGRRRLDLFAGRVQAVEALEAWLVRKARRGYVRRNSTASVNRPVHREMARLEKQYLDGEMDPEAIGRPAPASNYYTSFADLV
jgi:predicted DNA-binding WGR domain protein